jgi:hypothetical protein
MNDWDIGVAIIGVSLYLLGMWLQYRQWRKENKP